MSASIDFCRDTFLLVFELKFVHPLPDMPILGSSNSAANKDMMLKIQTNGDTII